MKYLFWALVACVLVVVPAAARPTDDAMSGAFRCAAIGEMRTWLDCYYGAAQPVRASLGMKPAPAAQTALVFQPPAGTVPAAERQVRDQVMSAAARCVGIDDGRQWLACYYAAAQPARVRLNLASASPMNAPPPATPTPAFGLPPAPVPPGTDVAARMQSYSFNKYGAFTVTLEDGQVWQQLSGDTDRARWNKPAPSYQVRISRGVLGSYNLQVRNLPGVFKVRRTS